MDEDASDDLTGASALSAEDILEIHALYARYNHAVDAGDGDAFSACFTADSVFDGRPYAEHTGRAALATFAREWHRQTGGRSRHHVSNIVLDPDGDGARGRAYLFMTMTAGTPGEPPANAGSAVYEDTLVRDGASWRFAVRRARA